MRTYEENGIVFIEEPEISNFLIFAREHLGFDSIVADDYVSDPRHTRIFAYVITKDGNRALDRVYQERYHGNGYSLVTCQKPW